MVWPQHIESVFDPIAIRFSQSRSHCKLNIKAIRFCEVRVRRSEVMAIVRRPGSTIVQKNGAA
jgi:hypothetical protein